jgi:hypothetical protein
MSIPRVLVLASLFAVLGFALAPRSADACSCSYGEVYLLTLDHVELISGSGDVAEEEAFWGDDAGVDTGSFWTLGTDSEILLDLEAQ